MSNSALSGEIFKSSQFLKWKRESQEAYIDANIGMAGLIAAQNDKAHQKCLEDWYYDDKIKSIDRILAAMNRFSEYHPRGVILAMMEKKCGLFVYPRK